MLSTKVAAPLSTLPADDDHPYRTGAWQPNLTEWDAVDLDVVGDLPTDLEGVYLRNTENPVHPSIGLYHPFDGDGMVHQLLISEGKASYRNRFVRTAGFLAEQQAAGPLWTGMLDMPANSLRPDGWGARTRMKDASSTDVVVHNGRVITSFWQCGDLYTMDPRTLEPTGTLPWVPSEGISAHTKVDERTREMLVFNYSKQAPYMHYGVVSPLGELVHWIDVPLPGPRLPHDMAFTESFSILSDNSMFWDPDLLTQDLHVPRFFRDTPMRLAVVPRFGRTEDIRWFECEPTYVLHWINAFEDGDEIVLDGFFQGNPLPKGPRGEAASTALYRHIDLNQLEARPRRYRLDLATGQVKEEDLSERFMEFGMINGRYGGQPYRYAYSATGHPGMFLFDGLVKKDLLTGSEEHYAFGPGRFGSETPMAPRIGATSEDDGYLVTFVSDVNTDTSEALILSAQDVAAGPICRIRLPERIASGTHSCWAPASDL